MLRDEHETMDETEVSAITHDIMQNSHTISNIIDNWMRTLALEGIDKVERNDDISCNEVCETAAETITLRNPDTVTLKVEHHVPDSLHIITDASPSASWSVTQVLVLPKNSTNMCSHSSPNSMISAKDLAWVSPYAEN